MGVRNGIEASQGSITVADIEIPPDDVRIIGEDELKKLTKGPLRSLLQSSPSGNGSEIFRLWKCLLHTFAAPDFSPGHGTAVGNAISSFLSVSLHSADEELRQFVRSDATWFSVFDVLLDRYEGARLKPMRQVLSTLTTILISHPDPQVFDSIRSRAVCSVVETIILRQPRAYLKARLHTLELFLQKGVLQVGDAVALGEEWLWTHHHSWSPSFMEHCMKINVPLSSLVSAEARSHLPAYDVRVYAAQILCLGLLFNSRNHDRSLTSGALICRFCCDLTFNSPNAGGSEPFWVGPLKYVALMSLDMLDVFSNHVLYPLFKSKPSHFHAFLGNLPFERLRSGLGFDAPDPEASLLFATLKVGKELGLVQEDSAFAAPHPAAVVLDASVFRPLLVHLNSATRLSALSLVVWGPLTTKPLSPGSLQLLKESLPYVHAEVDPHSRGELFSLLRRLVIRLRGASSRFQPDPSVDAKSGQGSSPSSRAKEFLVWYVGFLERELHASASYQTHNVALKVLLLLLQSGLDSRIDPVHLSPLGQDLESWRFSVNIFGPGLFRLAGDLLADAFDDVRNSASMILRFFPREILISESHGALNGSESGSIGWSFLSELVVALSRAEDMASRTGRADHSDTVARLYYILFDLGAGGSSQGANGPWYQHKHAIVDSLLGHVEAYMPWADEAHLTALRKTPLRGHLAALRYIVGSSNYHALVSSGSDKSSASWRLFHERIYSMCNRIWTIVRPVLCIDSPEAERDTSDEEITGPKDMLACSWRALRESSLLLHAMLVNSTYAPPYGASDCLNFDDFQRVGVLSFNQLAELRHRGAFSTVAQTFAACCQRCGKSNDNAIADLPEAWYKDALTIIDDQASKHTRRSAGIPDLITGIASSCLGLPLFEKIVTDLQNIARSDALQSVDGSAERLPQVHALNCLKDMFTNNSLVQRMDYYLTSSLDISAECLGSQIWAIRNCGLMLFRALMGRMRRRSTGTKVSMGGSTSGTTERSKISFGRYPGLVSLLSRLLEAPAPERAVQRSIEGSSSGELSMSTELVFPALELIGNKDSSGASDDDEALRLLVFAHTGNQVWGIRDHAARVYASLVRMSDILSSTRELADAEHSILTENQIHGRVLCVRYLLRRLWESSPGYWRGEFESAAGAISRVCHGLGGIISSPISKTALVEVFNDAIQAAVSCNAEDELLNHLMPHLSKFQSDLAVLLQDFGDNSTTARSSSLLLCALGTLVLSSRILRSITTPEELSHTLETVSRVDHDAGPWMLDRLHRLLASSPRSFLTLKLQLYARIILDTRSQPLKQSAISGMARELESIFDEGSSILDNVDLLFISLHDTLEQAFCDMAGNREFVNAILHLQGCILPLRIQSGQTLSSTALHSDLRKLILSMSLAMRDDTEFTTRHSAVLAMKCLITGLWRQGVKLHESPILLGAFLLLYDMLNDDDEELRDIAAETVPKLFALSPGTPLIARVASVQLATYLAENFATSCLLFEGALRRFLGRTQERTVFVPVKTVLAVAGQDDAILFAEEKQNQYINDLREVETWAEVLGRIDHPVASARLAKDFYLWVVDGLETVIETFQETKSTEGVLGWSSKPEVFVTGARVIRGAQTVLRWCRSGHCEVIDTNTISNQLNVILEQGKEAHVHEHWISWLRAALDSHLSENTVHGF